MSFLRSGVVQWLAYRKNSVHVSCDDDYHFTLVLEPQEGLRSGYICQLAGEKWPDPHSHFSKLQRSGVGAKTSPQREDFMFP